MRISIYKNYRHLKIDKNLKMDKNILLKVDRLAEKYFST